MDRAFLAYHQNRVCLHKPGRRSASIEVRNQRLYRVLQQPAFPPGYRPPNTDGEIQECGMNEKLSEAMTAIREIFVTLQHPRKDDGETLRCCLRNGRGIEPRQFLPKKGLRLTLSVVGLEGTSGRCHCLSIWNNWSEIGEYYICWNI